MLKRLFSFIIIASIAFNSNMAFAENENKEMTELKRRILALEKRLDKQQEDIAQTREMQDSLSEIKQLFEGLSIGGGITTVIQSTHNANGDDKEDVTDASYSVDLEIEQKFSDFGLAFVHLETGDGSGVEDELVVFSNVNRDADDSDNSISLTEVYYEHYFKFIPLTLTIGKIDPTCYLDTNEYANDECGQFLGHIFRNSPAIMFPDDNSFGARMAIEPLELVDIELMAMDANDDWEDVFDNMFLSCQINFKPNLLNMPGNYRIYGWLNDKEFTRWSDSTDNKEENYGFGLSFDQQITDSVGVFFRYSWQKPEMYAEGEDFSIEQSWSIGSQVNGSFWHRENDFLGVAFGQIFPSDDYKDAGENLKANSEEHLELYYRYQLNEYVHISPDLQVIWDPYGGDAENGDKTIVVGGVRAQVSF